ncbi:MAG: serine/threonine protein kinase, partial [Deltaproteobacteria bacterium]|nr:serine/threonine protein kinase [Deltaproteobacteria bacterium]
MSTTDLYPSGIVPSAHVRFCPQCDAETAERVCPADGTATLMRDAPTPNLSVLQPGYILNHRYRLERELGRGGFGAVFAARHTGTGQQMAVKVLFSAGDRTSLKRFFREARVTAQLKSKHTIRVFDFGQDDNGLAYLAMELLQGQPLNDELKDRLRDNRAFSEKEAIDIGVAVCKSLHEAHAAGLVHRDLKPHNIFCAHDEDGLVYKVLDFGIAKSTDQSLTGGSILGTVAYMSPEQAQSSKLDGRSDLYSLGVTLYQLVAGEVPFVGETPVQTLMMHIGNPPPPLGGRSLVPLTGRFEGVVERLLAKEPAKRYATPGAVVADLDPLRSIASDTSKARPVTVVAANAGLHAFGSQQDETMAQAPAGIERYKKPTGRHPSAASLAAVQLGGGAKTAPTVLEATAGMPAGVLAEASDQANPLTPMVHSSTAPASGSAGRWIALLVGAAVVAVVAVLALGPQSGPPPSEAAARDPGTALTPAVTPPAASAAAAAVVAPSPPPAAPVPAAQSPSASAAPAPVPALVHAPAPAPAPVPGPVPAPAHAPVPAPAPAPAPVAAPAPAPVAAP